MASALLLLVVAAIVAVLSGGLAVWERAGQEERWTSRAAWGLEILEKDFRNRMSLYAIPFEGRPDSVTFPLAAPSAEAGDAGLQIVRVRYWYDPTRSEVIREAQAFPGDASGAESEAILTEVSYVSFCYLVCVDEQRGSYAWQNTVSGTSSQRVQGVKVELRAEEGGESEVVTRSILTP